MNTTNASKYLDGMQINDRSVWDNKDIEHPLECLLEDYHQEQLKLLGIANVSNNEVACCGNCHLPLDNIEYVPKVQIADKKHNA